MYKLFLIVSFSLFLGASTGSFTSANACGGHKGCSTVHKGKTCAAHCMKAGACTDPACAKHGATCTKSTAAKSSKHACSAHCTSSSMKS
ncbi:MAG TPA: hypothetical protein VFX22_05225 [Candidatus Kapabacteria bacterium]|nr:hypothetical protein [Candidatus Kapabacteria bacterium]